ncbi:hypothetical protein COCON_G00098410 [Conger conger]|uniref:Uncharacterized protein n=1 Tax=Conger conger TaxID=82655 RepID=A0A9Q1DMG7_CONCO|nr:hypothetical protein COCON_G00098410 [Conger conger]
MKDSPPCPARFDARATGLSHGGYFAGEMETPRRDVGSGAASFFPPPGQEVNARRGKRRVIASLRLSRCCVCASTEKRYDRWRTAPSRVDLNYSEEREKGLMGARAEDSHQRGSAIGAPLIRRGVPRSSAFLVGPRSCRSYLRSRATLQTADEDGNLEMADVESEEVRDGLFAELLLSSSTWEETQHLALLLQAWPPPSPPPPPSGPDTDAAAESPWVRLTRAILSLRGTDGEGGVDLGAEVLGMCRSLQPTGHKLPVECVGQISGLLLAQPGLVLPALKLMAETGDEQLLTRALAQMRGVDKVRSRLF